MVARLLAALVTVGVCLGLGAAPSHAAAGQPGYALADQGGSAAAGAQSTVAPAFAVAGATTASGYRIRVRALLRRYGCGSAPLTIRAYRGHQGATDIYRDGRIYVSPRLSRARLPYVVAHECAHHKQWRAYRGDVPRMLRRMNAVYGGSGFTGIERNADCATVLLGLGGQHYSTRCSGVRRTAARNTLAVRPT